MNKPRDFNSIFQKECFSKTLLPNYKTRPIQGGREISAIIVTDDYLCYEEPKSPYNFFLILIFNELFKFKISDEWQH